MYVVESIIEEPVDITVELSAPESNLLDPTEDIPSIEVEETSLFDVSSLDDGTNVTDVSRKDEESHEDTFDPRTEDSVVVVDQETPVTD